MDANGDYIPLLGGSFKRRLAIWEEANQKWDEGFVEDFKKKGVWKKKDGPWKGSFAEWDGDRPIESEYMPDWPDAERTHLQYYEAISEGTPISPIFATPEGLARWLADEQPSDRPTDNYESWLSVIEGDLERDAESRAEAPVSALAQIKELSDELRRRANAKGASGDRSAASAYLDAEELVTELALRIQQQEQQE